MIESIGNYFQTVQDGLVTALLVNAVLFMVATVAAVVWRLITRKHKRSVLKILFKVSSFRKDISDDLDKERRETKCRKYFLKYFDKVTIPTFSAYRFRGIEGNALTQPQKTIKNLYRYVMGYFRGIKRPAIIFEELLDYVTDENDALNRVLIIYAEAGMGKTRLLRYLTYKLLLLRKCKKNKDFSETEHFSLPFHDYGVCYTEFSNKHSIDALIKDIKDNFSRGIKYLLLDGFDECPEYLSGKTSAADLLQKLFDELNDKQIRDISRIIITSRVDMLKKEGKKLLDSSIKSSITGEWEKVDAIKMNYFSAKQVMHRYSIEWHCTRFSCAYPD